MLCVCVEYVCVDIYIYIYMSWVSILSQISEIVLFNLLFSHLKTRTHQYFKSKDNPPLLEHKKQRNIEKSLFFQKPLPELRSTKYDLEFQFRYK